VVSLVAEAEGLIVGHVAFSPVSTAAGAVGLGLAPLAVDAAHRPLGMASRLVQAGLEAARQAGERWVVVVGEPDFYVRFGFTPACSDGLGDAYGGGVAFQVLALQPGAIQQGRGLVRDGPGFALVS
jgi:putative acetyltransferase